MFDIDEQSVIRTIEISKSYQYNTEHHIDLVHLSQPHLFHRQIYVLVRVKRLGGRRGL